MKYQITSQKSGARVEAEYDEKGLLKGVSFEGSDEDGINWMLNNIPRKEVALQLWMKGVFQIEAIVEHITFSDFWELYGHKVGKMQAEKQWNKLSMGDRAKAIRMIPRYKTFCAQLNPPRRLKDPERYLSNQTFNDEFKVL